MVTVGTRLGSDSELGTVGETTAGPVPGVTATALRADWSQLFRNFTDASENPSMFSLMLPADSSFRLGSIPDTLMLGP
jgi:hypothetical protein